MRYFDKITDTQTRWTSFENPTGEKGEGGKANGGAKGAAFKPMEPGAIKTLLDTQGSGIINRMWLTIPTGSHELMDKIMIRIYWDGERIPAVEVPLGAFFCAPLNRMFPFESTLFSSPEGRSFNCFIPMPFIKGAKITIANETSEYITNLFYDINYQLCPMEAEQILYFHAFWNRQTPELTQDYTVLPTIQGCGRFLGQSLGVRTNPSYGTQWFGEGEFKFYLDGDVDYPTLCGTGIEDYIGTAWGQGIYSHMTQGCTCADVENRQFVFYRFHTIDPIYFQHHIRVTVQDIGGAYKADVLQIMENGAKVRPVSVDNKGNFTGLFEQDFVLTHDASEGWYNYFRQDEFTSCAYFYLDRPVK